MWSILMFAVMMALTGFYATSGERTVSVARQANADNLAASMKIYRGAVIAYFTKYGGTNKSVSLATLTSTNMLPSWVVLYQQNGVPLWDNYRAADGTIYVYAVSLPPVNIIAEIMQLSHNSIFAGVYRAGSSNLQSPMFGDTNIPLTDLTGTKTVPDGAPVWIGMSN